METPARWIFGDMRMRIGAATRTTENQRPDTSSSSTTALYHGHLTSSQQSRYQQWKRNICLSQMQQEKYLHDVNYFGASTSPFQPLSSIRTIKGPLPSRKIQRTTNERNTSIFGTTSSVRRSKTTRFGSNTSPQVNNSLTSSPRRLDPRNIIIRVNYYLFSINLRPLRHLHSCLDLLFLRIGFDFKERTVGMLNYWTCVCDGLRWLL